MRLRVILGLVAVLLLGAAWYLYGGSSTPEGQPRLVRLNPANFSEFLEDFNAASGEVRLVAMLSPT